MLIELLRSMCADFSDAPDRLHSYLRGWWISLWNLVDSRHSWHTNLTSRTLGRNPRVHTKNPAPNFFSFSLERFWTFTSRRKVPHVPNFLSKKFLRMPHFSLLFKTTLNVSYPHERIKISGCTFEFKSNLNSNANQLIPIHLGMRREGAWLHLCMVSLYEKHFLV